MPEEFGRYNSEDGQEAGLSEEPTKSSRRSLFKTVAAGFALPGLLEPARKASLKGSKESLDKQNLEAKKEDLTEIKDRRQLEEFVSKGLLVKLPEGGHIQIDPNLPEFRRFVRPWTRKFLMDIAEAHAKKFPQAQKLTLSSAVRPQDTQNSLRKQNPNASDRSVHPTGATIDILYGSLGIEKGGVNDIRYAGMPRVEQKWLEEQLLDLESKDLIEATKEHQQPCYHVMVFNRYTNSSASNKPARRKK